MSYLCYSLDEAAKQLGMSETVLFRLSQFLKIPANAYDDVGYIAFNGDLSFNDSDLSFFRQVKERLLKGETLETIKQRMKSGGPSGSTVATNYHQVPLDSPGHSVATTTLDPETQALNTFETTSHLKKEAAKTFNRYKVQARPRLNQVFHNLAQQLTDNLKQGVLQATTKPAIKDSTLMKNMPVEPLWHPEALPTSQPQPNPAQAPKYAPVPKQDIAIDPYPYGVNNGFNNPAAPEQQFETLVEAKAPLRPKMETTVATEPVTPAIDIDSPWIDIIQAANQSPRALNVRLRAAAQTLRQKALYQIQQNQTPG